MDEQRFDHLAKALSGGLSRRGVLRGAAAGLAGAIGLRASRAGAAQAKKPVCHYTGSASNPWQVIEVAEPAYLTHLGHGDHAFVDCCDDGACAGLNTCGGGGVEGQCGCIALTYEEACGTACSGEVADGCGGSHVCSCDACPVISLDAPACFWLDCFSTPGECCWNLNGFSADSQAACQALDSCAPGGGGESGGGCYKWATSSDTQIAPPWAVAVDPTLTVSVSALDGSPHACWVVVSVSGFPADSALYPTFQDWWNIGGELSPVGGPWTSPNPIPLDASGSGSTPFISANNTVREGGEYVVTQITVGDLSWGPDQITC